MIRDPDHQAALLLAACCRSLVQAFHILLSELESRLAYALLHGEDDKESPGAQAKAKLEEIQRMDAAQLGSVAGQQQFGEAINDVFSLLGKQLRSPIEGRAWKAVERSLERVQDLQIEILNLEVHLDTQPESLPAERPSHSQLTPDATQETD